MNQNKTEIVFVIDMSGSMSELQKSTINGFNEFIEEQKLVDGEASVTLVVFNSKVNVLYKSVDINDVENLDEKLYVPGGLTALYDAVGLSVDSTGAYLKSLNEKDKPGHVMVVIITDGDENRSKEYTQSDVRERITHQTDVYNWQFIFLGANIDSTDVGKNIGIEGAFSRNYTANEESTSQLYKIMSIATANYRSSGIVDQETLNSII